MMDFKSMTTPMMTNLKLLGDTASQTVDATLYRQMIGSLMYLMNTRLDICLAVNTLSQYMVELRHVHLIVAKHVIRYLKGMIYYGLRYVVDYEFGFVGYIDLDWVGSVIDWESTLGCCFIFGSIAIVSCSRKKMSVALSTTKVEYIVACSTSSKVVWLRKMLSELFDLDMDVTYIYCDNHSCIKLSKNLVFNDRSKHIEIKYQHIHDMVEKGAVNLQYVATYEQVTDVLTKLLSKVKFEYFRDKLGVVPRKRE